MLTELHTLRSGVHLIRRCLSSDEVVLQTDDLVDTVAEPSHLLASLMQTVLGEAILHNRVVKEFPGVFGAHGLYDLELFGAPIALGIRSLKLRCMSCRFFSLFFGVLVRGRDVVLRLVEVVEGDLPDAGEKNFGAVADFGDATGQVAPLLTRLQRLVYVQDLLVALPEVARPHLIFYVLIPDPRIDDCVALHATGNLIQDVALTRIFCQIVPKFILKDFKEYDLLLLHLKVFSVVCVFI